MMDWSGPRAVAALTALAALALAAAPARANAPTALDKPALTATPAELLALARAAPAGGARYTVLRHEDDLAIDEQGRRTRRFRVVFALQDKPAAGEWDAITWFFRPAYEDRPRLRVRVIAPSGAATELAPQRITDAPTVDKSGAISEQRTLSAALPPLEPGCVLEYEVVSAERRAPLATGGLHVLTIGFSGPTSSTRITLSAPAARRAKLLAHGLPGGAAPVRKVDRGRESWTLALGPIPAHAAPELHAPDDAPAAPYLALSTAPSWSAVAREYRRATDRRIAEGPPPYPAGVPRAATPEAVRALAAWLHRQVRATGVGLYQAPVEPRAPAETVRRATGDETDRALLLAALLRQAGLRADLALVHEGPGRDADPELPGLDAFDRVLVRARVGGRDVWIDPAEPLARPGQLAAGLQGRRALIAADDTTALAPTPLAAPADNLIRQVRTYELSESGPAARVTEVSREGGAFEATARRWLWGAPAARVAEDLGVYMTSEYRATYARHASTPPAALETPFEVTVEGTRAAALWSAGDRIELELRRSDVFEQVPALVTQEDPARPPRRADFQWEVPHVFEIEHRLVLPPGFQPPDLPAGGTAKLGTATLAERYRMDGRTVVAVHRFESGKRRLTPVELATLRRELAAIAAKPVALRIDHSAWVLANAGKMKEAIAEIERLSRLHPTEALHAIELAQLYMHAGMGAAARRAARAAVALEPRKAHAHTTLAWALRHDSLGRPHGFDHDRAGALAAYARARQLEPTDAEAAEDLADLLSRDARGNFYQPGADLPRAIEVMRAAHTAEPTAERGLALAKLLLYTGDLRATRRVLEDMMASPERDAALVAAVAAGPGGLAEAIRTAGALGSGAGSAAADLFVAAVNLATFAGHHGVARDLAAHAGIAAPGTPPHTFLQQLAPAPPAARGKDPAALAVLVGRLLFDPLDPVAPFWDAQTEREVRPQLPAELPADMADLPRAPADSMLRAHFAMRVTGAPAAWRLEVGLPGRELAFYAALDGGVAKLVGSNLGLAGLGRHALRLAARGDLASAARCLDWAVQDVPGSRLQAVGLWGGTAPRDRGAIQLAGALLAGVTLTDADRPILVRCASALPAARDVCDGRLAALLRDRSRWAELEAHTAAWARRAQSPHAAALAHIEALAHLGRDAEAERELAALRGQAPADAAIPRLSIVLATARGDAAEAARRFEAVLQRPDVSASEQNNAAWLALFGGDLARGQGLARQAVGPDPDDASAEALHTLAMLEVEHGDLRAAAEHGRQAMANGRRAQPEDADWLLHGRIAESLGLRDDAIAAYRKASPGAAPAGERLGVHELARRRLGALGAPPTP